MSIVTLEPSFLRGESARRRPPATASAAPSPVGFDSACSARGGARMIRSFPAGSRSGGTSGCEAEAAVESRRCARLLVPIRDSECLAALRRHRKLTPRVEHARMVTLRLTSPCANPAAHSGYSV